MHFSHNCYRRNNWRIIWRRFKISASLEGGWVSLVLSSWPSWPQNGSHPVWPDHMWRLRWRQVVSPVRVWTLELRLESEVRQDVSHRLAQQWHRHPDGRLLRGLHIGASPVQWRNSGGLSTKIWHRVRVGNIDMMSNQSFSQRCVRHRDARFCHPDWGRKDKV